MLHGWSMRITITLLLILFSFQALSYSKTNHKHITKAAVDLVQRCELSPQLSEKNIDTLVDLNLGQDGIFKKMRLWHFPEPLAGSGNPAPQKQRAWLYGKLVTETTFDRWAKYLDDQIKKQQRFEQRLPGIGALLHYVQDLAVPAHAVPIFHPTRIANADRLDSWKKLQPQGQTLLPATEKICETISTGSVANVIAFLSEARRLTLKSLQKPLGPDCQGPSCRWSRYWSQAVAVNGFADYGCGGKDVFGKKTFKCEGEKYTVNPDVYKTFAAERFQDAVIASAQMLIYYYGYKSEGEGRVKSPQWLPTGIVGKEREQDAEALPNKKLLQWVQKHY